MDSHDIDTDHTPLNFGKYKGLTPDEISEFDPEYIVWAWKSVHPRISSYWLYQTCKDDLRDGDTEDEVTV